MIVLLLTGALTLLDSLYRAGDYEAVVRRAPGWLADSARSSADSVAALQTQAFAEAALGRNQAAAALFRRALALNPGLELDPDLTSPKIRAVFDLVKAEFENRDKPRVRRDTVLVRQPVSLAVLVPGLAQIKHRRTAKGIALLGAGALSAAGLGIAALEYEQAHRSYLATQAPAEVARRYEQANYWYRARSLLVSSTAVVWLYSLIDALVRP